jgi:hypothetical protein
MMMLQSLWKCSAAVQHISSAQCVLVDACDVVFTLEATQNISDSRSSSSSLIQSEASSLTIQQHCKGHPATAEMKSLKRRSLIL